MTYQVVNTSGWDYERLAPYTRDITAAMHLLAEKFPADVDVPTLAQEIIHGQRQLWLILDGEKFVSFCLTQTSTIQGTNTKIVTLTTHAGAEGLDCVDDMCREIEAWAKGQGAEYTAAEGRRGWGRALTKRGYREYAVVWRKPVEVAA